jgi:flavin-dependent dehydrogenase
MTDVLIIGGGPVGLAVAIAARRKGFRVTVADAMTPPIDKACGEGVLQDGIDAAEELGLKLPIEESYPIRGIRFHGEGVSVAAEFARGTGHGFRRTTLHTALVTQAESNGVELRWGCSVAALNDVEAKWVVGADGMTSRVRKWAGLEEFTRNKARYGFRQHFAIAPWTDHVEVHWSEGCQIYITPVASNQVGVALLSRDSKLRVREALDQFPELKARLEGVAVSSTERGALTATRRLRRVTRDNVALIGDASGTVDAITGEGLCLGFRQAIALAEAMERGNLAMYEEAHRRMSARPRFMAEILLAMDERPWLRRRVLLAFAAHPDLFSGFLAMHTGAARTADFAADVLTLGWRMLTI